LRSCGVLGDCGASLGGRAAIAMTDPDSLARTARALSAHGLSLPEHYLMCSAGYRVTLPPAAFVSHAFAVTEGDPRGHPTRSELAAALRRLRTRGLLSCLTAAALRADAQRRAVSTLPEVIDIGYRIGHVDFTPEGYVVHREVIRAIHGEDFLARSDAGFNLNLVAGRFDVYAVSRDECRRRMDEIEAGGDAYTGAGCTQFVGRDEPAAIAAWRPNRFVVREAGYHGVLRFVSDATEAGVAADGAVPRR
jgi:hypothetical protein